MRFWRFKMWWWSAVRGRRVFYAEGGCEGTSWWIFVKCHRSEAREGTLRFDREIAQLPGEVTLKEER